MAEKVTTMVLKVDLQCSQCRKKIKKVLCKFPQSDQALIYYQWGVLIFWPSFLKYEPELFYVILKFRTREIRNQVYDEKGNTVTVTVVCCSPEKCRDKLCSRGGKVIKSIEIKKERHVTFKEPKELEKPKVVVVEPEKPKPDGGKPQEKPKEVPKAPPPALAAKPPPPEPAAKPPAANPVTGIPPAMACYGPSYDGFGGGAPWYHGYGIPPPPQPRYDGYYGYEYGYPYGRGSNFNRCDAYFSEENPSSCSIM